MVHAAAAWLPATFPSHVELLEREMREAAITGITGSIINHYWLPLSTPAHAVMAEAGLEPVTSRREAQAARLLAKGACPAG